MMAPACSGVAGKICEQEQPARRIAWLGGAPENRLGLERQLSDEPQVEYDRPITQPHEAFK
jgi:hypothetical protein